jgi:hypothetical protein
VSAREARRAIPAGRYDFRELAAYLSVIRRVEVPLIGTRHTPDARASIAMQEAAALTKEVVR